MGEEDDVSVRKIVYVNEKITELLLFMVGWFLFKRSLSSLLNQCLTFFSSNSPQDTLGTMMNSILLLSTLNYFLCAQD